MRLKKSTIFLIVVFILMVVVGVSTRIMINRNPMLKFDETEIASIKVEIRTGNKAEDKDIELSQDQIKEFLSCVREVRMDNSYFTYGDSDSRVNFIIKRNKGKSYPVRHVLDNHFKINGVTYKGKDETIKKLIEFENELKK